VPITRHHEELLVFIVYRGLGKMGDSVRVNVLSLAYLQEIDVPKYITLSLILITWHRPNRCGTLWVSGQINRYGTLVAFCCKLNLLIIKNNKDEVKGWPPPNLYNIFFIQEKILVCQRPTYYINWTKPCFVNQHGQGSIEAMKVL